MIPAKNEIAAALEPVRTGLAADGYDLKVVTGAGLVIEVVAGPGACRDCLVPEAIMRTILDSSLMSADTPVDEYELVYPPGADGC